MASTVGNHIQLLDFRLPCSVRSSQVPNIREACQKAVDGHRSIKYKWLTAVAWDCMVMDNDEVRDGQIGCETKRFLSSATSFFYFSGLLAFPVRSFSSRVTSPARGRRGASS